MAIWFFGACAQSVLCLESSSLAQARKFQGFGKNLKLWLNRHRLRKTKLVGGVRVSVRSAAVGRKKNADNFFFSLDRKNFFAGNYRRLANFWAEKFFCCSFVKLWRGWQLARPRLESLRLNNNIFDWSLVLATFFALFLSRALIYESPDGVARIFSCLLCCNVFRTHGRVAPDWDLWRTLYRLSNRAAASFTTW